MTPMNPATRKPFVLPYRRFVRLIAPFRTGAVFFFQSYITRWSVIVLASFAACILLLGWSSYRFFSEDQIVDHQIAAVSRLRMISQYLLAGIHATSRNGGIPPNAQQLANDFEALLAGVEQGGWVDGGRLPPVAGMAAAMVGDIRTQWISARSLLGAGSTTSNRSASEAREVALAILPLLTQSCNRLALALESQNASLRRQAMLRLTGLAFLTVLVGGWVSWSTWRTIALPLRELSAAARNCGSGCFDASRLSKAKGEIADLTLSLQNLARKVSQSLEEASALKCVAEDAAMLERERRQVLELSVRGVECTKLTQRVCVALERQFPGARAAVFQVEGEDIRLLAAPRMPSEFGQACQGLTVDAAAGYVAMAACWGHSTFLPTPGSDPFWRRLADSPNLSGVRSVALTPIRSAQDRIVGMLALHDFGDGPSRSSSAPDLESWAQIVALAFGHRELASRLSHDAYHDPLTGLPNRTLLADRLNQSIIQARRGGYSFALLFLDLDRFKLVNDTYGHDAGDALLRQVSARLRSSVREGDTVARLGGDEFAILLPHVASEDDAELVANKILGAFSTEFGLPGTAFRTTPSIGISIFPQDGLDPATLEKAADLALYSVKQSTRNGFARARLDYPLRVQ